MISVYGPPVRCSPPLEPLLVPARPPAPNRAEVQQAYAAIYAQPFSDGRRKPHSAFRRGGSTRLPQNAVERAAPLHVAADVTPMNVAALIKRLSPLARARFQYVWDLTFSPPVGVAPPLAQSRPAPRCRVIHAQELQKCNVSQPATGPGSFYNVPFTVFESKASGDRQRFILWTKQANQLCDTLAYKAHVPGLRHVSSFLPSVLAECGAGRDFRTGFYQIAIPEYARHLFRYQDESGGWWELTRLPMGHCCSVELMQTLGAAASGHPDYVMPAFAIDPAVECDLWVDNIRYSGPRQKVQAAAAELDAVAVKYNITWKPEDTFNTAQQYDFVGIAFDHDKRTVRPSDKVLTKLNAIDFTMRLTAGDIEATVGRLVHASAISKVFVGSFYIPLKWARRIINSLNRGERSTSTTVDVPSYVRSELQRWIATVQKPTAIKPEPRDVAYTVFVDASLEGWGGVIVERSTNKITVLGARWPPSLRGAHINVLEAVALQKVVTRMPNEAAGGRVQIVVDNTTVRWVAKKGVCVKNRELNDAVVGALSHLQDMRCACSVQWIKSADNPADAPSRIAMSSLVGEALKQITESVTAFLLARPAG
jgi:hypothetical protein